MVVTGVDRHDAAGKEQRQSPHQPPPRQPKDSYAAKSQPSLQQPRTIPHSSTEYHQEQVNKQACGTVCVMRDERKQLPQQQQQQQEEDTLLGMPKQEQQQEQQQQQEERQMEEQVRFPPLSNDDGSSLSGGVCSMVDAKANPTQLFLRIQYGLWEMVLATLAKDPSQAHTWIVSKDNNGNLLSNDLPLHVACTISSTPPTVKVVEALISTNPQAVASPNLQGNLPVHLACQNETLLKTRGADVLHCLLQNSGMEVLTVPNHSGSTALQLASSFQSRRIIKVVKVLKDQLLQSQDHPETPTASNRKNKTSSDGGRARVALIYDEVATLPTNSLMADPSTSSLSNSEHNGNNGPNLPLSPMQPRQPTFPANEYRQQQQQQQQHPYSPTAQIQPRQQPSHSPSVGEQQQEEQQPQPQPQHKDKMNLEVRVDTPPLGSPSDLEGLVEENSLLAAQLNKLRMDQIVRRSRQAKNKASANPSLGKRNSHDGTNSNSKATNSKTSTIRNSRSDGLDRSSSRNSNSNSNGNGLPRSPQHQPSQQVPYRKPHSPHRGPTIWNTDSSLSSRPDLYHDLSPRTVHMSVANPMDESRDLPLGMVLSSRDTDGGELQFREQIDGVNTLDSIESAEIMNPHDPNNPTAYLSRLAGIKRDNYLLRRELALLAEENVSLKSDTQNKDSLIDTLKESVENERGTAQDYVSDLQERLNRLQRELNEARETVTNKVESEQQIRRMVAEMEATIAKQEAEKSAIQAALEEESNYKSVLVNDLESQRDEAMSVRSELETTRKQTNGLASKLESTEEELGTLREVDTANRTKLRELTKEYEQMEVQLRAMVESKKMEDKKRADLETQNETLRQKTETFRADLKSTTAEFQSIVKKLQASIKAGQNERDTLREQLKNSVLKLEEREDDVQKLKEEKTALEDNNKDLEENQRVSSLTLLAVTNARDSMKDEMTDLRNELKEAQEQAAKLEEELQGYHSDLASQTEKETELIRRNTSLQTKLDKEVEKSSQRQSTIEEITAAMERYQEDLAKAQQDKATEQERISDLESTIEALESKAEKTQIIRNQLAAALETTRSREQSLKEQNQQLQAEMKDLGTRVGERESSVDCLEGSLAMAQDTIEKIQAERDELTTKLETIQTKTTEEASTLSDRCIKLDQEVALQSTTISDLRHSLDTVRHQMLTLTDEFEELQQQHEGLQQQHKADADEAATSIAALQSTNAELTKARDGLSEALRTEREAKAAAVEQSSNLRDEKDASRDAIRDLSEQLQKLNEKNQQHNATIESLQKDLKASQMETTTLRRELDTAAHKTEDLQEDLKGKEADAVRLQERTKHLKEDVTALRTELDTTTEQLSKARLDLKQQAAEHTDDQEKLKNSTAQEEALQLELAKCDDLNKSYQIEIGRLLKLNTGLTQELESSKRRNEQMFAEVEELKASHDSLRERESSQLEEVLERFQSTNAVCNTLAKENEDLRASKRKLQSEKDTLVSSSETLQKHVETLSSKNKAMVVEAKKLRETLGVMQQKLVVSSKTSVEMLEKQRTSQKTVLTLEMKVASLDQQHRETQLEHGRLQTERLELFDRLNAFVEQVRLNRPGAKKCQSNDKVSGEDGSQTNREGEDDTSDNNDSDNDDDIHAMRFAINERNPIKSHQRALDGVEYLEQTLLMRQAQVVSMQDRLAEQESTNKTHHAELQSSIEQRTALERELASVRATSTNNEKRLQTLQSNYKEMEKETARHSGLVREILAVPTGPPGPSTPASSISRPPAVPSTTTPNDGPAMAKALSESLVQVLDRQRRNLRVAETLQRRVDDLQQSATELTASKTDFYNKFLKSERRVAELEASMKQLRGDEIAIIEERMALNDQTSKVAKELSSAQERIQVLQSELEAVGKSQQNLTAQDDIIAALETERDEAIQKYKVFEKQIETAQNETAQVEKTLQDLESRYAEAKALINGLQAKTERQTVVATTGTPYVSEESVVLRDTVSLLRTKTEALEMEVAEKDQSIKESEYRVEQQLAVIQSQTLGMEELVQHRNKATEELQTLQQAHETLQQAHMVMSQELESAQKTGSELDETRTAIETEKADAAAAAKAELELALAETQKRLETVESASTKQKSVVEAKEAEIEHLLQQNGALELEIELAKDQASKLQARLDEMKESKETQNNEAVKNNTKAVAPTDVRTTVLAETMSKEKAKLTEQLDKITQSHRVKSADLKRVSEEKATLEKKLAVAKKEYETISKEASLLRQKLRAATEGDTDKQGGGGTAPDGKTSNSASTMDDADVEMRSTGSTDWTQEIMEITRQYNQLDQTGDGGTDDDGSVATAASSSSLSLPTANTQSSKSTDRHSSRAVRRERLRRKVTKAFERQSNKISSLMKDRDAESERLKKSLSDVRRDNSTLLLENKILKSAGKELNARATKQQAHLQKENTSLREALKRLSVQTVKHQERIRKLTARQMALKQRNDIAVSYEGGKDDCEAFDKARRDGEEGRIGRSDKGAVPPSNVHGGESSSIEVVLVQDEQ